MPKSKPALKLSLAQHRYLEALLANKSQLEYSFRLGLRTELLLADVRFLKQVAISGQTPTTRDFITREAIWAKLERLEFDIASSANGGGHE